MFICLLRFRLFEEHKELLTLFTKFQALKTRDEQASSLELAEHAVAVMSSLDEGIRSIDNMDNFQLFLTQIGQSHCKIDGFQKEFFWVRLPRLACLLYILLLKSF